MANLYENIEKLCKQRGVNVTTMCKESGASRGSLTDLKNGRKQTLKYETINDSFGNIYVKHDICVNSEQEFQVIERNGEKYNVSLFENIMKFKREYADKGVFKHKADIEAIETGVRPVEKFDNIDLGFPFS